MNCYDILPLLSGHIDQVNTAQEEHTLQEHLASCPECRMILAQMEQNNAMLHSSFVQPPADLTDKIMTQVRKSKKKSHANKPAIVSAIVSGLAVAAVMALVFLARPAYAGIEEAASEELFAAAAKEEVANEAEVYEEAEAYEQVVQEMPYAEDAPETLAEALNENGDYGLADATEAAAGSEDAAPVKRNLHSDPTLDPTAPILVIRNADPSALETLSAYESVPLSEVAVQFPDTLITRLSSILPTTEQENELLTDNISFYILPLDMMDPIQTECIEKFETDVFYSPEQHSPETCIILLLSQADE